jgi:hypothetical protein
VKEYILAILPLVLVITFASGTANTGNLNGVGFYLGDKSGLPKTECISPWCNIEPLDMDSYGLYHNVIVHLTLPYGTNIVTNLVGFANLLDKPVRVSVILDKVSGAPSKFIVFLRDKNMNTIVKLTLKNRTGTFILPPHTGVTINILIDARQTTTFHIYFAVSED